MPDTKDWTSVIDQGCAQCGFRPPAVEQTGDRVRAALPAWLDVLGRPWAARRPAPEVWSPLEYGCHVRDVCTVFGQRLALVLTEDDPVFANWDQDEAAVEGDYAHQDPAVVAAELTAAAQATATAFDAVAGEQWDRPGRRGDGRTFTVRGLAVYFLHEFEHHLWDVTDGSMTTG